MGNIIASTTRGSKNLSAASKLKMSESYIYIFVGFK